ncbi:GGDEF domain-containing protein, partial [Methanocalculus natronophilus]|uniref:GGDEF domain-containing protein n=1 Tax=Methanocalculus natronophilus TaxID=1262400 RepID=UPI0031B6452C
NNSEYHLYICDLNNFKQVNDTLGHLAGDQVLYKFSTYLRRMLKPFDGIVYRIGGDEFAIIIPQNATFNFKNKYQEINDKLKTFHKELSLAYGEIDLSIKDNLDNKALDEILRQADENLYKHKVYKKV